MLRRGAALLRSVAARGAEEQWARAVGSSTATGAAAKAAAVAKAPNVQEVKIYRWNPDSEAKPSFQTYKVLFGFSRIRWPASAPPRVGTQFLSGQRA